MWCDINVLSFDSDENRFPLNGTEGVRIYRLYSENVMNAEQIAGSVGCSNAYAANICR